MYKIRRKLMRNMRQTFNIAKITITREETRLAYTIRREDQRLAHTETKKRTAGKKIEEQ